MDYLTSAIPGELDLLAPQVANSQNLNTAAKRRNYIRQASRRADGYCNRAHGLEISRITENVFLDEFMNGVLGVYPFVAWEDTAADIYKFGSTTLIQTLTLADVAVDRTGRLKTIFTPTAFGIDDSDLSNTGGETGDNSQPYFMNVSYRAGYFTEKTVVEPSGAVDFGTITLLDVDDLAVGQEFYFSTDPVAEPDIDLRRITAIDTATKTIEFEPELSTYLVAPVTLRQVDRLVRLACAEIIADLITFPANTQRFRKNLGKSDLEKEWTRTSDGAIPLAARVALNDYILV